MAVPSRFIVCISLLVTIVYAESLFKSCTKNNHCDDGELCVRSKCRQVIKDSSHPELKKAQINSDSIIYNSSCWQGWPDVNNCVQWWVNETSGYRMAETNNVPDYYVPAYCPFGIGQGYCQSPTQGNSTDCTPFAGKVCPCTPDGGSCPTNTTSAGDVMVPTYQFFMFPLHPDPTDDTKPLHMYNNSALTNGNAYQVIGAMNNGVQIKGPAEANGFNVDTSLIPLPCGGHVTPPVGPGPVYHYHKAPDCLDNIGESHYRIGYAADGHGIYGYDKALSDECNGHFGPVDANGTIEYHYHAAGVYNLPDTQHKPYYMGCLGPAKGKCNSTVNEDYDGGANWCGAGCGYEICVEPGTDKQALDTYLDQFPSGSKWLKQFSVNPF